MPDVAYLTLPCCLGGGVYVHSVLLRASVDAEAFDWVVLLGTMLGAVHDVAKALADPAATPAPGPLTAAAAAAELPPPASAGPTAPAEGAGLPVVPVFPTVPEVLDATSPLAPPTTRLDRRLSTSSIGSLPTPLTAHTPEPTQHVRDEPPAIAPAAAPAAAPGWLSMGWLAGWLGGAASAPLPAAPTTTTAPVSGSNPLTPAASDTAAPANASAAALGPSLVPGRVRVALPENTATVPPGATLSLHDALAARAQTDNAAPTVVATPVASPTKPRVRAPPPALPPVVPTATPSPLPVVVVTPIEPHGSDGTATWMRRRERFDALIASVNRSVGIAAVQCEPARRELTLAMGPGWSRHGRSPAYSHFAQLVYTVLSSSNGHAPASPLVL